MARPEGRAAAAGAESFGGFLQTALGPQEVLTEIRVPRPERAAGRTRSSTGRAQDWATVGVAAVRMNGDAQSR